MAEISETGSFVHLNCHSDYSLHESTASIQGLVNKAKEQGMPGLALTDLGNLFGTIEFHKACNEAGIDLLVGTEVCVK